MTPEQLEQIIENLLTEIALADLYGRKQHARELRKRLERAREQVQQLLAAKGG